MRLSNSKFSLFFIHFIFIFFTGLSYSNDGKTTKKYRGVKYKSFSVTGRVKAIDNEKKTITILQILKKGERVITFETTPETVISWKSTKMRIELGDINPGVKVKVGYYQKGGKFIALKIILPGGMKEAAQAIFKGEIKAGDKK